MRKTLCLGFMLSMLCLFVSCIGNTDTTNQIAYLELTTDLVKTEYFVGESISTEGLEVKAHYQNGRYFIVTDYSVTLPFTGAIDSAGSYDVIISYKNKKQSYQITVKNQPVNLIIEPNNYYKKFSRSNKNGFNFYGDIFYKFEDGTTEKVNSNLEKKFYINGKEIKENDQFEKGGIYTVEVKCNGFSGTYQINVSHLITFDYSANNYDSDQIVINSEIKSKHSYEYYENEEFPELPTLEGTYKYFFDGWYFSNNYTGTPVTEIPENSNKDITFYGKFYLPQINYVLNGGTLTYPNSRKNYIYHYEFTSYGTELITNPYYIKRNGYIFEGWSLSQDSSDELIDKLFTDKDVSVYAVWTPYNYPIYYNLNSEEQNDSENPDTFTVEDEIILKPAVKEGYVFLYWKDSEGNRIDKIEKGSLESYSLYPVWKAGIRTIEYFNVEGAENNNPTTYEPGTAVTLEPLSRTGYTFGGWYRSSSMTGAVVTEVGEFDGINLRLYAKWTLNEYSITYELNEGSFKQNAVRKYTYESNTVVLISPARSYYNFEGWYLNSDFTGETIDKIPAKSTGNVTVYAKWSPVVFNISYFDYATGNALDSNVDNSQNPSTFTREDIPLILQEPSRNGYDFVKWYERKNGYYFTLTSLDITELYDIELCAVWNPIDYTIQYVLNEGTNNSNNKSTYTIETQISLYEPTRSKHRFIGWYESEDFSGEKVENIPAGSTGNKVFYAKWEACDSGNISLTLPEKENTSTLSASKTTTSTSKIITYTASEGFESYKWYIDGQLVSTERSVQVDGSGNTLSCGIHSILVIAFKNGEAFSYRTEVSISK